jgi:hypothetical protein
LLKRRQKSRRFDRHRPVSFINGPKIIKTLSENLLTPYQRITLFGKEGREILPNAQFNFETVNKAPAPTSRAAPPRLLS